MLSVCVNKFTEQTASPDCGKIMQASFDIDSLEFFLPDAASKLEKTEEQGALSAFTSLRYPSSTPAGKSRSPNELGQDDLDPHPTSLRDLRSILVFRKA